MSGPGGDLGLRLRAAVKIADLLSVTTAGAARAHLTQFRTHARLNAQDCATLTHATGDQSRPVRHCIDGFRECAILFPLPVLADWRSRLADDPEVVAALEERRSAREKSALRAALEVEAQARKVERVRRAACDGMLCRVVLEFHVTKFVFGHLHVPCRLEQSLFGNARFRVRPLQTHADVKEMPADLLAWRAANSDDSYFVDAVDTLWAETVPLLLGRERADVAHELWFDESTYQWVFALGDMHAPGAADALLRSYALGRLSCEYLEFASTAWQHVKFARNPRASPPLDACPLHMSVANWSSGEPSARVSVGKKLAETAPTNRTADSQTGPPIHKLKWYTNAAGASAAIQSEPPSFLSLLDGRLPADPPDASLFGADYCPCYLVTAEFMRLWTARVAEFVVRDAVALVCAYCGIAVSGTTPPLALDLDPRRILDLRPFSSTPARD